MKTILIVEDDLEVAGSLAAIFEYAGFSVDSVHDGSAGVKRARELSPDLIICDVNMPCMNGFEVLEHLRQDPITIATPFIFLTAFADTANMRRGMTLGADDYITKPFNVEDVIQAVHTRLKRRDTLEERHETTLKLLRKNISYALPHELRTPLMNIMGYTDIMMMDYEKLSASEAREMLQAIFSNSTRLHNLIENALIYAQLEIVASDPVQIDALRNHVIPSPSNIITAEAERIAESNGRLADLSLNLADRALQISHDDLTKIIIELVDNAFKFSEPGTKVRVKSTIDGDHYTIYIQDSGRGMTPEQVQQIGAYMQFERAFYEQQGVGFGFIIARRLIELHGGEMAVRSVPDKGTIISFRFSI